MRYKFVRQEGIKDCGVCCLYNIIKYYGGYIDMNKLRVMTNTDENGTTMFDLVNTSNKLNLKATAYKCEINYLCKLSLPIIAHIKVDRKYTIM